MQVSRLFVLGFSAILVSLVAACATSRELTVESLPPGATIAIDGTDKGAAPVKAMLSWSDETVHVVSVAAPEHETHSRQLSAKDAASAPEPWLLSVALERLSITIPTSFTTVPGGASISIDGGSSFTTPCMIPLTFARTSATAKRSANSAIRRRIRRFASRVLNA